MASMFVKSKTLAAPKDEILQIAIQNCYYALLGITATNFQGPKDPNFFHVPEEYFGERSSTTQLKEKYSKLEVANQTMAGERDKLKDEVTRLNEAAQKLYEKNSKLEDHKLTSEADVKKAFEELQTERLLDSKIKGAWAKDKADLETLISAKDATIAELKKRYSDAIKSAKDTIQLTAEGFKNNLASYVEVGYYFQSRLKEALGQPTLPLIPRCISSIHITAMNRVFLSHYEHGFGSQTGAGPSST